MGGAGRKGAVSLVLFVFGLYDTPFVFRYACRMSEGPLVLLVYGKGKSKSSTAKVLLRHRWDGVSGPRRLGGRQCFYAIAWPVSWALVLFFVLFLLIIYALWTIGDGSDEGGLVTRWHYHYGRYIWSRLA